MNNIKTYQQFINESNGYIPTFEEGIKDIETVKDAMDKQTKLEIANKYGIKSAKIGDIVNGILKIMNDVHKSKSLKEYTNDDFEAWWRYFNYPMSTVLLKKALDGEKIEWCEFVLNKANELVFAGKRGDYWTKAQRTFEKYINGILNKDKNSKDVGRINLIATLTEKTKEFHDTYIRYVKEWARKKYDSIVQMKNFEIEDYMSVFGVLDKELVINRAKGGRNQLPISEESFRKYFAIESEPYTAKKSVVIFGSKYEPTMVKKAVRTSYYSYKDILTSTGENFADIPNKLALKQYSEVVMFSSKYKWNLKAFTEDTVNDAERKFNEDIEAIAEKVRKMNMEEDNIQLLSIESDPKHFDITLTDGKKVVHARSIFAAEFSEKVTPHYRFIIT
ncbi:hypothetical protein [uncultured Methanobrevibacter sp.]|uniref:hypothetical protein n=1 Tax=uncultured Methanobrevibacter sp. TaxID=253161 RepID=UPI0025E293DE|nr:hypothetical protein [uncultured Methanobrevibacter sp.]